MSAPSVSISVEEIIEAHDASITRYGGLAGIREEGCLEQVHGNAMLAEQYSGNEDGTLGLCFVGSLMFYLIKGQCFSDGNKRTGLAVALKLLGGIGLTIDCTQDQMKLYCEQIADDRAVKSEAGVCPKAENAVVKTTVAVNKRPRSYGTLQSQMQFKAFAQTRRQACALGKSGMREWSGLDS